MSDKIILTPPYPGNQRGGLWAEARHVYLHRMARRILTFPSLVLRNQNGLQNSNFEPLVQNEAVEIFSFGIQKMDPQVMPRRAYTPLAISTEWSWSLTLMAERYHLEFYPIFF